MQVNENESSRDSLLTLNQSLSTLRSFGATASDCLDSATQEVIYTSGKSDSSDMMVLWIAVETLYRRGVHYWLSHKTTMISEAEDLLWRTFVDLQFSYRSNWKEDGLRRPRERERLSSRKMTTRILADQMGERRWVVQSLRIFDYYPAVFQMMRRILGRGSPEKA